MEALLVCVCATANTCSTKQLELGGTQDTHPEPLSVSNLSLQYPYDIGKRGTNHVQRLGCAVCAPRTWLPLASFQCCFGRLAWMQALLMQGHRLLSRLFKHRTLMGRQHHPHPLKYTAVAFPAQKATPPLGRFKSIGSSILAASWCRGSEENTVEIGCFPVDTAIVHDHRDSCCWRCGRCCIAGDETSYVFLRRVLLARGKFNRTISTRLATFPQWVLTCVRGFCHS